MKDSEDDRGNMECLFLFFGVCFGVVSFEVKLGEMIFGLFVLLLEERLDVS